MALPVLRVRDKHPFSLARNPFLRFDFVLADPSPAVGATAPAKQQETCPFPLPVLPRVRSQGRQVRPDPVGYTIYALKLQVRGCSCSRFY